MPLRIAFDMDGVLADMDAAVAREAETVFKDQFLTPHPVPVEERETAGADLNVRSGEENDVPEEVSTGSRTFTLTARQQRKLWRHLSHTEDFWAGLDEIEPGSVKELWRAAVTRKWEVIFLTKRPSTSGATAQIQTQRWLQRLGFPLPSVFVVTGSRGLIAQSLSLDFVVDDRPENCLDVVLESRAKAILVWRASEQDLPAKARRLGIGVVHSVAECLDILTQVDERQPKPGMMERIVRALGLQKEKLGTGTAR